MRLQKTLFQAEHSLIAFPVPHLFKMQRNGAVLQESRIFWVLVVRFFKLPCSFPCKREFAPLEQSAIDCFHRHRVMRSEKYFEQRRIFGLKSKTYLVFYFSVGSGKTRKLGYFGRF